MITPQPEYEYDVFISHGPREALMAGKLREDLRLANLTVYPSSTLFDSKKARIQLIVLLKADDQPDESVRALIENSNQPILQRYVHGDYLGLGIEHKFQTYGDGVVELVYQIRDLLTPSQSTPTALATAKEGMYVENPLEFLASLALKNGATEEEVRGTANIEALPEQDYQTMESPHLELETYDELATIDPSADVPPNQFSLADYANQDLLELEPLSDMLNEDAWYVETDQATLDDMLLDTMEPDASFDMPTIEYLSPEVPAENDVELQPTSPYVLFNKEFARKVRDLGVEIRQNAREKTDEAEAVSMPTTPRLSERAQFQFVSNEEIEEPESDGLDNPMFGYFEDSPTIPKRPLSPLLQPDDNNEESQNIARMRPALADTETMSQVSQDAVDQGTDSMEQVNLRERNANILQPKPQPNTLSQEDQAYLSRLFAGEEELSPAPTRELDTSDFLDMSSILETVHSTHEVTQPIPIIHQALPIAANKPNMPAQSETPTNKPSFNILVLHSLEEEEAFFAKRVARDLRNQQFPVATLDELVRRKGNWERILRKALSRAGVTLLLYSDNVQESRQVQYSLENFQSGEGHQLLIAQIYDDQAMEGDWPVDVYLAGQGYAEGIQQLAQQLIRIRDGQPLAEPMPEQVRHTPKPNPPVSAPPEEDTYGMVSPQLMDSSGLTGLLGMIEEQPAPPAKAYDRFADIPMNGDAPLDEGFGNPSQKAYQLDFINNVPLDGDMTLGTFNRMLEDGTEEDQLAPLPTVDNDWNAYPAPSDFANESKWQPTPPDRSSRFDNIPLDGDASISLLQRPDSKPSKNRPLQQIVNDVPVSGDMTIGSLNRFFGVTDEPTTPQEINYPDPSFDEMDYPPAPPILPPAYPTPPPQLSRFDDIPLDGDASMSLLQRPDSKPSNRPPMQQIVNDVPLSGDMTIGSLNRFFEAEQPITNTPPPPDFSAPLAASTYRTPMPEPDRNRVSRFDDIPLDGDASMSLLHRPDSKPSKSRPSMQQIVNDVPLSGDMTIGSLNRFFGVESDPAPSESSLKFDSQPSAVDDLFADLGLLDYDEPNQSYGGELDLSNPPSSYTADTIPRLPKDQQTLGTYTREFDLPTDATMSKSREPRFNDMALDDALEFNFEVASDAEDDLAWLRSLSGDDVLQDDEYLRRAQPKANLASQDDRYSSENQSRIKTTTLGQNQPNEAIPPSHFAPTAQLGNTNPLQSNFHAPYSPMQQLNVPYSMRLEEEEGMGTGPLTNMVGDLNFSAYYNREVSPIDWQSITFYVYRDHAHSRVMMDAAKSFGVRPLSSPKMTQETEAIIEMAPTITVQPYLPGFEFSPSVLEVELTDNWERLDFKMLATGDVEINRSLQGALMVTVDGLLIGYVPLEIYAVLNQIIAQNTQVMNQTVSAYQNVYPCFSFADEELTRKVENAARSLGMEFTREVIKQRRTQTYSQTLHGMLTHSEIFQLFWSDASSTSSFIQSEWENAIRHNSQDSFVRPIYWETPIPFIHSDLRRYTFIRLIGNLA